VLGHVGQVFDFALGERALLRCRVTEVKESGFENLARHYQATGADHDPVFDDGIVGYNRTHADQALIADTATMQQDLVPNRNLATDMQFGAVGTVVTPMGNMQHAAVLDIGVIPDTDFIDISTDYGKRPYRAVLSDYDISDYDRGLVDIAVRADTRGCILETANHCFALVKETRIVTIFSRHASVFGEI